MFGPFRILAMIIKLRYVRAGNEGLVPGSAQDDDASIVIFGKGLKPLAELLPHFQRHRIAAHLIVKCQKADVAFQFCDDATCHDFSFFMALFMALFVVSGLLNDAVFLQCINLLPR